jgi:hypothetical protein
MQWVVSAGYRPANMSYVAPLLKIVPKRMKKALI